VIRPGFFCFLLLWALLILLKPFFVREKVSLFPPNHYGRPAAEKRGRTGPLVGPSCRNAPVLQSPPSFVCANFCFFFRLWPIFFYFLRKALIQVVDPLPIASFCIWYVFFSVRGSGSTPRRIPDRRLSRILLSRRSGAF